MFELTYACVWTFSTTRATACLVCPESRKPSWLSTTQGRYLHIVQLSQPRGFRTLFEGGCDFDRVFANYFASADFCGQTNLDHIYVETMPALTNVSIAGCGIVKQVRAGFDSLPSSNVDAILITLDQAGMRTNSPDGSLDVELQGGANGVPSPDGVRAALNLSAKNWVVLVKPQPSGTPQIQRAVFIAGSVR
jgi:hypothetical protein